MKKYSVASAPGKIHLIGEHSAVFGKPALLAAIDKRVVVQIEKVSKKAKPNKALLKIQRYLNKKYKTPIESFFIKTSGDLPSGRGLGSSAAYSTALTACLFDYYKLDFDLDEIYKAAYVGEKFFHGNPSGGDLAAVVYGGIIYFRKETENLKLIKKITPKKNYSFFAVDSGKALESTKEMVLGVSKLPNKLVVEFCFRQEALTKQMADGLISGLDISETIKKSQKNLEKIGVVSLSTQKIIKKLNNLGFPSKISGGGGIKKGSGMLFTLNPKNKKTKKIEKEFKVLELEIENEGVKIEPNKL